MSLSTKVLFDRGLACGMTNPSSSIHSFAPLPTSLANKIRLISKKPSLVWCGMSDIALKKERLSQGLMFLIDGQVDTSLTNNGVEGIFHTPI